MSRRGKGVKPVADEDPNEDLDEDPNEWGQHFERLRTSIDDLETILDVELRAARMALEQPIKAMREELRLLEVTKAAMHIDAQVRRITSLLLELNRKADAAYERIEASGRECAPRPEG